jgi:hypothetical protein
MISMTLEKIRKLKKINRRLILCYTFCLICILLTVFLNSSRAAVVIENDSEVETNTELTYYLDVTYDGVDRQGKESSNTVVSEIQSGYIYVEDEIPAGLTFQRFVTSTNGTIGSVARGDETKTCTGKVVDDTNEDTATTGRWNTAKTEYTYHGLHYNTTTGKVTFQVKNLQAGCKLTVGIVTLTPSTIDDKSTPDIVETRRDFYNFATAREKTQTVNSNTVHVFMGKEFGIELNKVKYVYENDVPDGAPTAPSETSYVVNTKVQVATTPVVEGYEFSGWTTTDVTVDSSTNKFIMPNKDVTFKGTFTKIDIPEYKVTYKVNNAPKNYIAPSEKSYAKGDTVTVDSLKTNTIINGYKFLGWTITTASGTEIKLSTNDNTFAMPEEDVTITGNFEEVKYKVTYKFTGEVMPDNAATLLPQTKTYAPGTKVTLEKISNVDGYKFLGWNKDETFTMPNSNVTVYGEWRKEKGTFTLRIDKEIEDSKQYFQEGEDVVFVITVYNDNDFDVTDVKLQEDINNVLKYTGEVDTTNSMIITIDKIKAKDSVKIYTKHTVKSTDKDVVDSPVEILGGLAEDYELSEKEEDKKNYKDSATYKKQQPLQICNKVDKNPSNTIFQIHIVGISNNYDTWIQLQNDGECKKIYLDPSKYKISEVIPQEFNIKQVTGNITSNNATLEIPEGTRNSTNNYVITFINEYKKKGFFHSSGRVINKVEQQKS